MSFSQGGVGGGGVKKKKKTKSSTPFSFHELVVSHFDGRITQGLIKSDLKIFSS